MVDTREKFREMLNDIAATDGITKFNQLAEMTGINAVTFTRIKNNEIKSVSVDTFKKLNSAFDDRYNLRWFQGDSPYMLIKDYQNAQKDRQTAIPEYASLLNAALAAKDETIEAYQKRLEDKDVIIESLRAQITEKDERIAELKAHNIDLRRQLDQYQNADIDRYPFPIGAADGDKRQRKSK